MAERDTYGRLVAHAAASRLAAAVDVKSLRTAWPDFSPQVLARVASFSPFAISALIS